jgi:hypothetical protein
MSKSSVNITHAHIKSILRRERGNSCVAQTIAGRLAYMSKLGLFSLLILGAGFGGVVVAQKADGNADADLRPLVINGPFVVQPADLANLKQQNPTVDPEADAPGAIPHAPCNNVVCNQQNDGAPNLPLSPLPTVSFAANTSIGTVDPGIAVGTNTVLVLSGKGTGNAIGVYDKAGNLLGPKPGSGSGSFPNPFRVDDLFNNNAQFLNAINSAGNLKLPPGLPANITVANGFGISANAPFGATGGPPSGAPYYDARVAYDQYRKRFFIVMPVINQNMVDLLGRLPCKDCFIPTCAMPPYPVGTPCGPSGIASTPALKYARRDYVLVAVSRTEDVRDGFLLYFWDGSIDEATCNSDATCPKQGYGRALTSADYPTIAISEQDLLVSIGSTSRDGSIAAGNEQAWLECTPRSVCGMLLYDHLQSAPAQQLADGFGLVDTDGNVRAGCAGGTPVAVTNNCPGGWHYGLPVSVEHHVSSTKVVRPAMSNGQTTSQFGYFASYTPYLFSPDDSQCGCSRFHVWTLDTAPATPSLNVKGSDIRAVLRSFGDPKKKFNDDPDDINNIFFFIRNAVVQSGDVIAAGFTERVGEGRNFGGVRTVQVALTPGQALPNQVLVDRTLWRGNVYQDQKSGVIDYSWPSVGLNATGDLVVGYLRSSNTLPVEIRYSVKFAQDPDFRPSTRLRGGEHFLKTAGGLDTTGAAMDPIDGGFWIANLYADDAGPGNQRIWVGKVLGGSGIPVQ